MTVSAARAHDLDGPAAPRGRAPPRPVEPAARDLRRLGRPPVPDAAVRGAPRRRDHAGVGHDRDEPARLGRAPAGRRTRRGAWRYRATAGPPVGAGRGPPHAGRRRGGALGRRRPPASSQVRGPGWRARITGTRSSEEKFDDGWLRTGDIAAIDERGYIIISDRAKDVIKSGGEWISSVELENEIMAHPEVLEAAVIALPDERWGERPLACVVLEDGDELTLDELNEHLAPRVAKWWLPDAARDRRRGPQDERRQVRQEGAAPAARGGRGSGSVTQPASVRRLDDVPLELPVLALEAHDLHRLDRVAVLGARSLRRRSPAAGSGAQRPCCARSP